jgi:hypothetical protein
MKSGHQVYLSILNLKILFSLMISYIIFLTLFQLFLKSQVSNRFAYIHQNSSKCHNLQSRLWVEGMSLTIPYTY